FDAEQRERVKRWKEEVAAKWERLTPRERDVLQLLAEGQDNKTIATSLGITIHTVEKHLKGVYRKLGVTSRAEALRWWMEKGTDFRT
ncbi:MAG: helix-turn-helix transcriptional regulator, partial [candidate division WOR-3 bacterium]